jgi:hypothetical protein
MTLLYTDENVSIELLPTGDIKLSLTQNFKDSFYPTHTGFHPLEYEYDEFDCTYYLEEMLEEWSAPSSTKRNRYQLVNSNFTNDDIPKHYPIIVRHPVYNENLELVYYSAKWISMCEKPIKRLYDEHLIFEKVFEH